jgi:hypothetical protein
MATDTPTTVTQAPLPLSARLTVFLSTHAFYGYRDLLADCFDDNPEAFIDAYCSGILPPAVSRACEETLAPGWLQVLLLRRVSRQLSALLAALG